MHTNNLTKKVALVLALVSVSTLASATQAPTTPEKEKANGHTTAKRDFDWDKYVNTHIQYPAEALEAGIWGDVTVQFTVMPDGTVTQVKSRGDNKLLRQEAERLVRQSEGLWQPSGTAERIMTQKISFRLQMDFSDNAQ
jgi:TonB family protein